MAFSFLRRVAGSDDRLDHIERTIAEMLAYDHTAFGLAMDALLGEADPAEIGPQVHATDRKVNQGERSIRRELVVHASVVGAIDTPALLVYMSIVKDIERVGDYAKNLLDLARDGARLEGHHSWASLRDEVADYLERTTTVFADRDAERARAMLAEGDVLLDRFDDGVSALVRGSDEGSEPVARALALRYLKRIVAHLMNVLSSVVMPLDKLDYFDEDPEDREPERDGGRPRPGAG
jgi:phosphate uptake regulator